MGPENGMNPAEVFYFPMEEYVKNIKLNEYLLEHLEETNANFDKYLKYLSKYDDYSVIYYWISLLSKEMKFSQAIEREHYISPDMTLKNNVFFDSLQMNNSRIKKLHQFVTFDDELKEYRNGEVRVSRMTQSGEEEIYWHGAKNESLKMFMDDFIKLYKQNSVCLIHSNPFLKSALVHLLFVRIHPFTDGNGRTARMIHNIKFTESINKIHGMKLKISPLNLSQSILINQPTYAKRINDIYFDLEHDSNDEINKWFDFILNMYDEQLYYSMSNLPKFDRSFHRISVMKDSDNLQFKKEITKMKLKT